MDTLFELDPVQKSEPAFSLIEQLKGVQDDIDDAENEIEGCQTRISELEDALWHLNKQADKLRQQIASHPDAQRELEEKEQADAERKRQQYYLEARYKTPYRRDIADYWQQ